MRTNTKRLANGRHDKAKTNSERRSGGGASRTNLPADPRTLTVHLPLRLHRRGGRKLIVGPDGLIRLPNHARVDNALIKALARAHRWQKLIETGTYPDPLVIVPRSDNGFNL